MATRSLIGIAQADQSIRAIYCHWDGYPRHNGAILQEHYATPERVHALLDLGDLWSLGPELGEQHDFETHTQSDVPWCLAYGRDRGEEGTEAKTFATVEAFLTAATEGYGCDFAYLFVEGEWYIYPRRTAVRRRVADALADERV